jgi:hypothetical protein
VLWSTTSTDIAGCWIVTLNKEQTKKEIFQHKYLHPNQPNLFPKQEFTILLFLKYKLGQRTHNKGLKGIIY